MFSLSTIKTSLFVLGSLLATLALTAPRAHANAYGVQPVPAFKVTATIGKGAGGLETDLWIPSGFLAHGIKGGGRTIKSEVASYRATPSALGLLKGKVCNWRLDFTYKGTNGRTYLRDKGRVVPACGGIFSNLHRAARPKKLQNYGRACAELYSNGKRLAAQCHNITR